MSAKRAKTKGSAKVAKPQTEPKFPYTTKPASLRRLLKEIPKKPKPEKFDMTLLRSWGFSDANDYSMLRVLKAVNLLNAKNEPTDLYSQYMKLDEGAKSLGPEIRRVFAPLFQASHTPFNENNEKLTNLFHIHSGGAERTLEQQIQTFKALCENAVFEQGDTLTPAPSSTSQRAEVAGNASPTASGSPAIHINLHIHLPENKTRRDYEDIIEDIGRHIFGRTPGGTGNA